MCQSSAVSRRDRRKVDPGYAVGLFLLLSAGFEGWFALVFPFWLLALTGILLVRARRLPPSSGSLRLCRHPSRHSNRSTVERTGSPAPTYAGCRPVEP